VTANFADRERFIGAGGTARSRLLTYAASSM
jgi:hypothetical protein